MLFVCAKFHIKTEFEHHDEVIENEYAYSILK